MTYRGATEAQAVVQDGSDDQAREQEYRRRLETVVVPAVNDADGGEVRLCPKGNRVYGLRG